MPPVLPLSFALKPQSGPYLVFSPYLSVTPDPFLTPTPTPSPACLGPVQVLAPRAGPSTLEFRNVTFHYGKGEAKEVRPSPLALLPPVCDRRAPTRGVHTRHTSRTHPLPRVALPRPALSCPVLPPPPPPPSRCCPRSC